MNEKLKKMMAKGESFEFPDRDLEIEVKQLTVKEMSELARMNEEGRNSEAVNYITYRTLRKALPAEGDSGISDDKLQDYVDNDMASDVALELIRKVMEISDLVDEEDLPDKFRE